MTPDELTQRLEKAKELAGAAFVTEFESRLVVLKLPKDQTGIGIAIKETAFPNEPPVVFTLTPAGARKLADEILKVVNDVLLAEKKEGSVQ